MNSLNRQKSGELKVVVYDNYMGNPFSLTFLGSQWWITTPGDKLQTVDEFTDSDDIGFSYLCEADGKVGALALARMLGRALENPEDQVDEVLRQRVKSLKRLGVTLDVKDEPLTLELDINPIAEGSIRQGKYAAICHLHDNYFEMLFNIDAFETKHDAEEWVGYYFDMLEKLGIEFRIV